MNRNVVFTRPWAAVRWSVLLLLAAATTGVSPADEPKKDETKKDTAKKDTAKKDSAKPEVKPLKVLLVTGGCCHDYAKQKDILKEGLEARAHVVVEQLHTADAGTGFKFEKYGQPNRAEGYDVIIHDECCADVKDQDFVQGILAEHKRGVPGVNLHCAMHSYRVSPDYTKPSIKPFTRDSMWFDYIGIQSSRHGAQMPIALTFLPTDSPITKGMADWTTIKEELYNNVQIFDTATPLIRGKQGAGDKQGTNDTVVAWTNLYGDKKTRVFSTTLGHNNETVGDDRYLNLVTRGLLWACDKLNDDYLKPFDAAKAKAEAEAKEKAAPQPTPAKEPDKKADVPEPKKTGSIAKPVDSAVAGVKVPPGFEATLFAGPPDVNYPTCLSATPDGVLYVGCDENGSLDNKPGRGRVVRCVDKKRDGVATEFNVFTKVDSPRGVIFDHNTLYVLHPPRLSAYIDDNGDGVADREEILVEGIGRDLNFRGADHTTNGIRLGIDGWIYIAVGDYGFMNGKGKDGKSLQFRGGGVIRVRTDGTGLEAVSHGQRNIYDVAVDPFLNIFTRDNTNDGGGWDVRLSHVVPYTNFGYPTLFKRFGDEIIQPLTDSGGGSPTGALFVDEGTLPAPLNRTLLTCEWGRNAIHRHELTPKGATFSEKQETFVEIPQPTDIDVDANGRIYVSSWKGGGFKYSGPNVGFVTCIRAAATEPKPVQSVKTASEAQLVEIIGGTSHSQRVTAQREILRRGEKPGAIEGLKKVVEQSGDAAPRVAAMFTLAQLLGPRSHGLLTEWTKKDDLREHALRALAERREDAAKVATQPFVSALNDANPRVRLQAAIGLGRIGTVEIAEPLVPLVADADLIVSHVAINALVELRAVDACLRGADRGPSNVTAGCFRVLQQIHEPAVVQGLVQRLAKTRDETLQKGILTTLLRLAMREGDWDGKSWWGTRPDTTGPYFKAVAWEMTDEIKSLVAKSVVAGSPELRIWILNEARRLRVELSDMSAQIMKLVESDPTFRAEGALLLVGLAQPSDGALDVVADVARDAKQPAEIRVQLLRELIKRAATPAGRQRAFAVVASVDPSHAPDGFRQCQQDLLNVLAQPAQLAAMTERCENGTAAEQQLAYSALIKMLQQPKLTADAKVAVTKTLDHAWTKNDTTVNLLRAIGATDAVDFSFQVRAQQLRRDPAIQEAAQFAATELRLDVEDKNKVVIEKLAYEKVLEEAQKEKGDVPLGARLFTRQGCANCHTTDPKEPPKGPFLGGIAARYKRPELIESILKPSAKIAQGFETQIFAMTDGTQWTGFVSRESGDEVELRGQNAVVTVLQKKDIEARKRSEVSSMPDGLVKNLSVPELAAIVAYLESLPAK